MIVDDRLETVLRTNVAGKTAARTQLRQLVDLLGPVPLAGWNRQHAGALQRIDSLVALLDDEECAAVLRSAPHRSPILVYHFAQCGPRTAAAAVAAARLASEDWLALIPRLPTQTRGFVRHRSDLSQDVRDLLSRLGINDFLLPQPEAAEAAPAAPSEPLDLIIPLEEAEPDPAPVEQHQPEPEPEPVSAEVRAQDGIGAIVRRIEAFRRTREERAATPALASRGDGLAPLLPFGEEQHVPRKPIASIDLRTDALGSVVHASVDPPGMLVGSRVFTADPAAPVHCNAGMAMAFRLRQPITAGALEIEGAEFVAGSWQADGTPLFAPDGGRFTGYLLRLRRPVAAHEDPAPSPHLSLAAEADRLRQLLHELRTPINAIQGFAEMIQSQVFGATPHQYRAMAASIAADAAQMLAGFEEIERLVKLESGAIGIDSGQADATAIVARLIEQVSPILAARNVRLAVAMPPRPLAVAFAADEIERSVWRLLSVVATSVAPAERMTISLDEHPGRAALSITLPASLDRLDDEALFAPEAPVGGGALAASAMLGNGFALRLARAEFEAGGGSLNREGSRIVVELPLTEAVPADRAAGKNAA
ncbi:sensor histidine kinase [Novosphingobium jiangmenense]|uniref:histidine kinase n=1 Tax=Novosphingobium jiangmenense TaxID=2791981 RepID=A0ABS0HJV4_9SPHN|nr:HAMP domain-containing histidine kinase [Novosphingobium jiangmenense]MBF9152524.1 HAMP domain-containing histidine kinase [Novosphingobium jiangmenense]